MDADPGLTIVAATVLLAFDVTLTRSVVVRVAAALDDYALAALTPATAVLVTDHTDVLDASGNRRRTIGKRRRAGGAHEKAGSTSQKRNCKFVHIHNQLLEVFLWVGNGSDCRT